MSTFMRAAGRQSDTGRPTGQARLDASGGSSSTTAPTTYQPPRQSNRVSCGGNLMQTSEAGTAEGPQDAPVPPDDLVPGLGDDTGAGRPRRRLRRYLLLSAGVLVLGLLGCGLTLYLVARSDLNS